MRQILILGGLVCLTVSTASAQDPVKVDPKHYSSCDMGHTRPRAPCMQSQAAASGSCP